MTTSHVDHCQGAISYSDSASAVSSTIPAFAKKGDLLIIDSSVHEPIGIGTFFYVTVKTLLTNTLRDPNRPNSPRSWPWCGHGRDHGKYPRARHPYVGLERRRTTPWRATCELLARKLECSIWSNDSTVETVETLSTTQPATPALHSALHSSRYSSRYSFRYSIATLDPPLLISTTRNAPQCTAMLTRCVQARTSLVPRSCTTTTTTWKALRPCSRR